MRKNGRNEDAVSPVIGVMLMIVVTVIIAAIVSGFASGMGDTQKAAPAAAIQCSIVKVDADNVVITLKHVSGDSLKTADLRFYVSYVDSTGTPVQKRTQGVSASRVYQLAGRGGKRKGPVPDRREGGGCGGRRHELRQLHLEPRADSHNRQRGGFQCDNRA